VVSEARDWLYLRERLVDLAALGGEMVPGIHPSTARFLFAVVGSMARDAAQLAQELEAVLVAEAAANGVELPEIDLGGDDR
jgi:hypothetical protein